MHLKIKIDSTSEYLLQLYQNHTSFHEGDSGLDLFTPEDVLIPPKSKGTIDTGVKCAAYFYTEYAERKGRYLSTSFWMLPRSSVATKTPLILANSMGLIDAGYRGNLMGVFYNTSDEPFLVEKGTRVLQICSPLLSSVSFELVECLSETSRGTGGYGSTGK
jgi:dUTP pyrophosphatase